MKTPNSKIRHLFDFKSWYKLKYRKTFETNMHKHFGNLEQLKLFVRALGQEGWQIVWIKEGQERDNGGDLKDFQVILAQRERHIGEEQLKAKFNIE